MKKDSLLKMKNLPATEEMLAVAREDVPVKVGSGWNTSYRCRYSGFARSSVEGGILKVTLYDPDAMRLGGTLPVYEIFMEKEKQRAEQAALEKLDAMSPAELLKAAAKRVSADTEKLTRRNMKESVSEFIQTKCIDDLDFARLTMHPRKSMIHCFQYISRKSWDYVQDELKANGVQPGPGQQGYGCDIPDDLCYQWAEDYFHDPDAKEDQGDEEEFVPQPYRGKTSSKSVSKKKKEEKKNKPEKKEPPKKAEADDGQISLGDLSSFGEAA